MKKPLLTCLIFLLSLWNGLSQTLDLSLNTIKTGFSSVTSIAHCDDDRLFIVEQAGLIRFFYTQNPGQSAVTFLDIRNKVKSGGEEGLLGLVFDLYYAQNGRFYVYYTDLNGNQVVSRFTTNLAIPDQADPTTETILLQIPHPNYSNHNGGCLQINPSDGHLYIATGDGGGSGDPSGNAQNGQSLLGKLLRLNTEGNIPDNNPFIENSGFRSEIWAYGLRNPWKFSFDRKTHDLWIADVGQGAWEEVNFMADSAGGGQNYGWKCYEGNSVYSPCSLSVKTDPVFQYSHSNGCSITGGYVYRGNLFKNMYGHYFAADYCSGNIWSLLQESPGQFKDTLIGKFTSNAYTTFGEDMYGELYIAEKGGKILRLETSGTPRAEIEVIRNAPLCEGNPLILRTGFNPQLSYSWYRNDTLIQNANQQFIQVHQSGIYKVLVSRDNGMKKDSAQYILQLDPLVKANANASNEQLCEDATLPITLSGTPEGGTFSGTRVEGNTFNPFQLGAGVYPVYYTYTSPNGCHAVPDTLQIRLLPLPVIELNGLKENYCIEEAPDTLTASPEGGLISGPGIENGVFYPERAGLGEHLILYTYTDSLGCTSVEDIPVSVEICGGIHSPEAFTLNLFPNPLDAKAGLTIGGINSGCNLLQIYNAEGKTLRLLRIPTGSKQIQINLYDFPAGLFLVRLMDSEGNQQFGRFIKR